MRFGDATDVVEAVTTLESETHRTRDCLVLHRDRETRRE